MLDEETEESIWYKKYLQPHEPVLRAWLSSRYASGMDVDDVVQEATIRVLRSREGEELKSPKAYFFAIARNLALDRARRVKVVFDEEVMIRNSVDLIDERENVSETVARNHELEILTEAIQSLPARCRQVFTLSKVYGMTYNEIAEEMDITFNTVSAQISIGLSRCADFMRRHGRDEI